MRKILCYRLVFVAIPFFFNSAQSQPDHFAYAITAVNKVGTEWVALRKLDTRTGEFSSILLNMQGKGLALYDFSTYQVVVGKAISNSVNDARGNNSKQPAPGGSVAAIAYDRKANRLYYTPMNEDQLRYVDLSTMKVFVVMDQFFSKAANYGPQPANPITRLVIAPDDYGYTVTNDGNHLIRFTTNGVPTLTDLGELLDDPLNNEMTIHNPCANSGGDLIADDAGHLYLISASNRVYKVDITTRMTSFLATISGLPLKFTSNGAAVNEDGKIIVSSSVYADAYFIVDPETWNALPSLTNHEIYGSADLANSNVLLTKTSASSSLLLKWSLDKLNKIKVFPDPVFYDIVNIQFNELSPGNYTIQLANVLGRNVMQQKATITARGQIETMHIPSFAVQGLYYLRILDNNNNVVGIKKLVVERW